ncbi:MAG: chalcone isomerase family protein [Sporocytophaga sp.]|uniref:chalcone isomerase family protein n=1 Tax=Sporocytophaga sp. TaxID=2231183 RepID=UPI001B17977F|nr:chalcone isomerase family protein [Sporocytophaga sp.]MBO9703855.1 chalcone isomerase family protein [Sporocytophaga sp.]
MSKLKNLLILVLLVCSIVPQAQSKGKDNKMPDNLNISAEKQQLVLNGWGVRRKFCMDLFEGGLYLKERSKDANKIIQADEPMSIRIHVVSDLITSKRLEENMRSEFDRVTNGNWGTNKANIETVMNAFKEDVNNGDVFDLVYLPGIGLRIYKNNKEQALVKSLDFKKLLYSIWLGNDPQDAKLKKGMMG